MNGIATVMPALGIVLSLLFYRQKQPNLAENLRANISGDVVLFSKWLNPFSD